MINFRRRRITTAAAMLTMLAGFVAVPAAACPRRIAASHSQTHRGDVRYAESIVNLSGATS